MPTRPTVPIPAWCTTGAKIEPSAGKVAQGWLVNERPPAEWWNWIDNSTGQWLAFLDALTRGDATPDLALNFASLAHTTPLIDVSIAPPASGYKLVLRTLVGTVHQALYSGATARKLVLATNAVWDGSNWHCENTSQVATAIALFSDGSRTSCELLYHAATASTWADSAWLHGNISLQDIAAATINATTVTATTVNATTVAATTINANTVAAPTISGSTLTASTVVNTVHLSVADDAVVGSLECQDSNVLLAPSIQIDYKHAVVTDLPRRYINVPLSQGKAWPDVATLPTFQPDNGVWLPGNGPCRIEFPFAVPYGCLHVQCYAVYRSRDPSGPNKLQLWHWARSFDDTAGLMAPPSAGEALASKTQTVFSNAAGDENKVICETLNYGVPDGVEPGTDRYSIVVTLDSSVGAALFGAGVAFRDPGPRNY